MFASGGPDGRLVHKALRSDPPRLAQSTTSWAGATKPSLHNLEFCDDADAVAAALRDGSDIGDRDRDGLTSLHVHALKGHLSVVHVLLEHDGVEIDAVDYRGRTALLLAASRGQAAVVRALLKRGTLVERRDDKGSTALYHATAYGCLDSVRALLGAGADHACAGEQLGWTALHVAAWKGHTAVLEALLQAKADPRAQTHDGRTPLEMARGIDAIVDLLVSALARTRPRHKARA